MFNWLNLYYDTIVKRIVRKPIETSFPAYFKRLTERLSADTVRFAWKMIVVEGTAVQEKEINMKEYGTIDSKNQVPDVSVMCGREPLPEPYESVARMVYGNRAYNEAVSAVEDFGGKTVHRWRQRPEMIARVRFLARSQRRQLQDCRDH
jgi:hypothetical protein